MRSRLSLILTFLILGTLALPHLAQASIPFLPPQQTIIPTDINQCAAGFGEVMVVINNIIEFALTVAMLIIAPIMIAYSGFLLVFNSVNPSGKERARQILWNTIVGLVIAFAAWLIVDALMAAIYDANAPVNGGILGEWSQLITTSGGNCLIQTGSMVLNQANLAVSGVTAGGNGVYVNGGPAVLCNTPACNPTTLTSPVVGFTPTQAKVMSCIAYTENSGYSTGCNKVNACGTFQIVVTVNKLSGKDCAQYNNGNPTINCPALCHGNNGVAVTTAACQPCVQAANNAACNAESAKAMYDQSGYAPWTTSSDNTKAPACVSTYGNG